MFILKTIYKVKIIDLKKQIIQSELKSGNLRLKDFSYVNDGVAKSFLRSNRDQTGCSDYSVALESPDLIPVTVLRATVFRCLIRLRSIRLSTMQCNFLRIN